MNIKHSHYIYLFYRMKPKAAQIKEQQLMRKLANVKDVLELKRIYGSVQQQNSSLRQDILSLKYKVDVLMQKQKTRPYHTREDDLKAKQLEATQKELKSQYRIMQELKKRQQVSKSEKGSEEINSQCSRIENQLRNIEQELILIRPQVTDLKSETSRLEASLSAHEDELARNQPKIKEFSEENKELRKKILSVQKLSSEKEYQSVKVMNSMYTIKTRYSKNEELFNEIERQKLSTIKEKKLPKQELLNLPQLEREVEELKRAVKQKEREHIQSENSNFRLKEQMMEKNKELVKQAKELEDKRSRAANELNKFKRAWQRHLQIQSNNKYLKQYIETAAEAIEFTPPQTLLRRDFAGILGGKNHFDDRTVLKENTKSFITGFFIYELDHVTSAKNLLVAIRAIYDDAEASAANQVPIPGQYLSKCKVSKYVLVEGDFVKLLKVKYNANESRILKLEIRTNRNNRYQFGDKRNFTDLIQGENVYGFDISVQEYPVSLFGSYNYARSQWFMESLGVEINDL